MMIISRIKTFVRLLAKTLKGCLRDRWDKLAAVMTYFAFLSIVPMLVALLAGAAKILGIETPQGEVVRMIEDFFHPKLVVALGQMLDADLHMGVEEIYSMKVIGIFTMAYGALGYAGAIKFINEYVWKKDRVKLGVKPFIKRKTHTLLVLLVIIILALSGLLLSYLFPGASSMRGGTFITDALLWPVRNLIPLASFFLLSLFYFIYFPPLRVRLRDALPGALLGALLQVAGREILHSYLDSHGSENVTFAESMLLMLYWMYYTSLMLVYSAEFNRVYIQHKRKFEI